MNVLEYYIEYVIFQELVVDFILLYLTGTLLGKRIIYKRIFIASIIGVLYTLAVFYTEREFLNYFFVKFFISILLITIALSPSGFIGYFKTIICFYILSILIVGIIFVSYFIFKSRLTIILLFLAIFIVYILFKVLFCDIKYNEENKEYYRDITIYLNGNIVNIKGFIDTGNEMVDTLSQRPVVIANMNCLESLFGKAVMKEINKAYENKSDGILNLMMERLHDYNFRIIKFETISNKDEYMLCIVPDRTIIMYKDKSYSIDCLIGLYNGFLNEDNKYQALLFKKILSWEVD